MSRPPPALEVARVSSGYGEALVIRDIELALEPGEIFAILGKNGMGKTTLLKTIMGFLAARGGAIRVFGEEITGLPPYRIARKAIAYSPQEQALFQDLSVVDNLRLGLADERLLEDGLERVGRFFPFLLERRRQRAGTLSGGEQKMLLVARALMSRPRLMLVDEITEGLQPSVIQKVADVLRAERTASNVAVLLIEQNVRFALAVADRYAVLKRGEIVDSGRIGDPDAEARIDEHLSM
ncbi:MAG TPA: ABC transporter ATP-binding protein [Alphaproteobacteria bacterium]|nr:ABC transporter ATP-binding protein [Alphaproteobacteria bacterium]